MDFIKKNWFWLLLAVVAIAAAYMWHKNKKESEAGDKADKVIAPAPGNDPDAVANVEVKYVPGESMT